MLLVEAKGLVVNTFVFSQHWLNQHLNDFNEKYLQKNSFLPLFSTCLACLSVFVVKILEKYLRRDAFFRNVAGFRPTSLLNKHV